MQLSNGKRGGAVVAAVPPRRSRRRERWPYVFVIPMLLCLAVVFVYPLVTLARDSFFSGTIQDLQYVGMANYSALANDPVFITSLFNNLKLLITVPITTVFALVIALLLYEGTRGWRVYRVVVFVPYIIPATAIGISFSLLLQKNGVINQILNGLSLPAFALDWLGNDKLAIYTIGAVIIWSQLGFGVVVFTAALLGLPQEVNEAAVVDGASRWQRYRYVVVPQLRSTIEFFLVLQAIQALAWAFPYVYVMTRGGPGSASSVMDLYIWHYAFEYNSPGISSAAAVILLLMACVLIYIYSRLRNRQGEIES